MISDLEVEKFKKNGYLLLPGVLNADEVGQLRAYLILQFQNRQAEHQDAPKGILVDIFNSHEQLRWLLWHEPTRQILATLLGHDFVVLRECAAHYQQFGHWHKDTSSQENAGHFFQYANNYLMVEVVYYLQDNSPEYGGGLDVEPGSHLKDSGNTSNNKNVLTTWIQEVFNKSKAFLPLLRIKTRSRASVSIPSRAGDLLIFDFRINHRATPPKHLPIPPEKEKYAVFIACSRNNEHVEAYHNYLKNRPEKVYDYIKSSTYSKTLLKECKNNNINLA